MKIGFLVNPIAGMGGRVGLKGTDGVVERAKVLGARPLAGDRAERMLARIRTADIEWLTCRGGMGENSLRGAGIEDFQVVYSCPEKTTAQDTKSACSIFVRKGVELILFCGGDGTAKDIFETIGTDIPMLGIPAGVKMHSGVFGINPERCADILEEYVEGKIGLSDAEVMDLDEEKYRQGEWQLKVYGYARIPHEPAYVQGGKFMVTAVTDDEAKEDIARHVIEEMDKEPGVLYILGPGSTLKAIGDAIGIDKTLLGIDALLDKKLIEKDVNEKQLLDLLNQYKDVKLVISPIGAQGFILGRGNHQLSPDIIKQINLNDIWVVSTPAKLRRTPILRVDTGCEAVDAMFTDRNYIFVITGYREKVMRKVER